MALEPSDNALPVSSDTTTGATLSADADSTDTTSNAKEAPNNTQQASDEQKENNNNNNNNNKQDVNDEEAMDLLESEMHHVRENVISTTKIVPIIQEIAKEDPNIELKNDEDATNKPPTRKQKQTMLQIEHGHCSEQGSRPSMEDQVVMELHLNVSNSTCTTGNLSIFGVFDGHGGKQCAVFCASHLVDILSKYLQSEASVPDAFRRCIAELDEKVIEVATDASGSTCCVVLIDNESYDLWCCNVGDSRCILVNKAYDKVTQLSVEHKPSHPLEKQRIEAAKGWVTFGRVCGILAVSRSLGDKDFKSEIEGLVVSTPDVTHRKLAVQQGDHLIILACDGLFDVFSNEQCMAWIGKNTGTEIEIQSLTQKLCHDAIHVKKSKDNVSILMLKLALLEVEVEVAVEDADRDEQHDDVKQDSTDEQHEVPNGHRESAPDAQEENISPKKHKFHVVMGSEDGIEMAPPNVHIESQ